METPHLGGWWSYARQQGSKSVPAPLSARDAGARHPPGGRDHRRGRWRTSRRDHQVARQLGIGTESLRTWLRQAEIDAGQRPGLSSEERERLKALERENRELRRANEILRTASAFFAAGIDRPSSR